MGAMDDVREWDLDIDRYLNHIIPPPPLRYFPAPISRFLGYRRDSKKDVGNVPGAFWSLIGGFCGLAVIAAVFNNTDSIQARHPPIFIASFVCMLYFFQPIQKRPVVKETVPSFGDWQGASAVLEYNAIRSPLGQPRNALLGHTFSALVGVAITKLFRLRSDFEKLRWVAAAVSCGCASAVMLLTGTVHPPGGASAVLAAAEPVITDMGWYFVGLVLFGTTLMVLVGLVINNIQRQFPIYWWTPIDLRQLRTRHRGVEDDAGTMPDGKGAVEEKTTRSEEEEESTRQICITYDGIVAPEDLSLNRGEVMMLQSLRERLRKRIDEELGRRPSSRPSSDETIAVAAGGQRARAG